MGYSIFFTFRCNFFWFFRAIRTDDLGLNKMSHDFQTFCPVKVYVLPHKIGRVFHDTFRFSKNFLDFLKIFQIKNTKNFFKPQNFKVKKNEKYREKRGNELGKWNAIFRTPFNLYGLNLFRRFFLLYITRQTRTINFFIVYFYRQTKLKLAKKIW